MKEPLIPMSEIPQEGAVTADLLGREVLVTMLQGKPRAYVNVCMHHGGPLRLDGDTFTCDWYGSTFEGARARRSPARCDPMRD
jgi:nitrite reductase/ring-hydroxylating ferredoxin subunit